MNYWLVKSEPDAYSWDDLVKDRKTAWTGVRNFQARNHLKSMAKGDRVFFYHSVTGKCIVGEAEVQREYFPDPTAEEGDWVCVELKPLQPLPRPVSLEEIKKEPNLAEIGLLRQSRLSVVPLKETDYKTIMALARK